VQVTGTGDHTALAGIMRLVAEAQTSRSRAQVLADRAAFVLTFVAIAVAAATLVGWSIAGAGASFVVERVVTVLVIACPHARGLEEARNVSAVFFDMTGTLTRG
jgi:Cu2+-exporting ATPase